MSKTYGEAEIQARLKKHRGWVLGDDGQLHADFSFKDFARVMLFVNAVGHLAEVADHHPDIFIYSYKNVTLSIMSHDAGGITDRDFELIARIEALPQSKPKTEN